MLVGEWLCIYLIDWLIDFWHSWNSLQNRKCHWSVPREYVGKMEDPWEWGPGVWGAPPHGAVLSGHGPTKPDPPCAYRPSQSQPVFISREMLRPEAASLLAVSGMGPGCTAPALTDPHGQPSLPQWAPGAWYLLSHLPKDVRGCCERYVHSKLMPPLGFSGSQLPVRAPAAGKCQCPLSQQSPRVRTSKLCLCFFDFERHLCWSQIRKCNVGTLRTLFFLFLWQSLTVKIA